MAILLRDRLTAKWYRVFLDIESLKELSLYDNRRITDLTPLSGLVKLEKLELRDNPISDWSSVEHVPVVSGRPQ
jgi:Leucine-rich repeat (LRR) protein